MTVLSCDSSVTVLICDSSVTAVGWVIMIARQHVAGTHCMHGKWTISSVGIGVCIAYDRLLHVRCINIKQGVANVVNAICT